MLFSSVTIECNVDGNSMCPTFNNNYSSSQHDVVFVNTYDNDIDYKDIVVVQTDTVKIIKRVVGFAGDKISIVKVGNEYLLERNGEIVEEKYIRMNVSPTVPAISQNGMDSTYKEFQKLRKSQADYFESKDDEGNGLGAYIVPENSIFVLGDNREVSKDSSSYGAFNMDNFVGKVELTKKYDESYFHFYYYYILEGKIFKTLANCF